MKEKFMNAVFEKELRQFIRDPKLPLSLALFLSIITALGIATLSGIFSEYDSFTSLKDSYVVIYKIILGLEYAILMFMLPALTANAISGEREGRTLDLLLSTAMNPYKIVFGKVLSAVSKVMLYAIASLPIVSLVFVVGVMNFSDIGEYFGIILSTSFYIGSFGILMSVCFSKTSTSTIASYSIVLLVFFGSVGIVFLDDYFISGRIYMDVFDYLLLLNPFVTLYVILSNQMGMLGRGLNLILADNIEGSFVVRHWIGVSILAQSFITVINIFIAGFFLNPLRKR